MALRRSHWLGLATALACGLPGLTRLFPSLPFSVPPDAQEGAGWGLAAALALYAILTLQLNQTRLAFSAALMGASALLWRGWTGPASEAFALWSLALPLGAALGLGPPEGSLFSGRSAVRLVLAALPLGAAYAFRQTDPAEFARLLRWHPAWAPSLSLPYLALPLLAAAAATVAASWDTRLEDGLWAQIGGLLGLLASGWAWSGASASQAWPALFASHLALAGGLLVGAFFLYWGRVYLDELTGLPNRRALDERLQRLGARYSLAMVDIDHFKKFNDTYGHEEGDNVLRLVAKHLRQATGGRAFRYGGEEFCAVFQGDDAGLAYPMMEAAREGLAQRTFSIRLPSKIRKKTSEEDRGAMSGRSAKVQVTISIGIASPDAAHRSPSAVIQWADQGLYKAKENGRNNVVRMDK